MSRTVQEVRAGLARWANSKKPGLAHKLRNQLDVLAHQIANVERTVELETQEPVDDLDAEIDAAVESALGGRVG